MAISIKATHVKNRTYKVCVDSCDHSKVVGEFGGMLLHKAMRAGNMAVCAFCKVEVICEQTGEVMYNVYYSAETHNPCISYDEIIDYLRRSAASN